MTVDELNALSKRVLDAAFAVHTELGPGLLENTYVACLIHELIARGLRIQTEVPCPVVYKGGKLIDIGYRMDILVEGEVVVEVKAVDAINPVHRAQLLTYLKFSNRRLGLLLNFNVISLREGTVRMANRL